MEYCKVCGSSSNLELHHIIYRSHVPSLAKCKHNLIQLCDKCHRDSKFGVHHNKELNRKIKLKFQNKLEMMFLKTEYSTEEIKEILDISLKATERLLKVVKHNRYKYTREDVIRVCMGGKTILIEGEDNETIMEPI